MKRIVPALPALLAITLGSAALAQSPPADKVARGKYLVTTSGCNDWSRSPRNT